MFKDGLTLINHIVHVNGVICEECLICMLEPLEPCCFYQLGLCWRQRVTGDYDSAVGPILHA